MKKQIQPLAIGLVHSSSIIDRDDAYAKISVLQHRTLPLVNVNGVLAQNVSRVTLGIEPLLFKPT